MKTCYLSLYTDENYLNDIKGNGQLYQIKKGQTLLNNLLLNNIHTQSKCGGKAICGYCRVKVLAGQKHCNKPLAEEKNILSKLQIEQGWRLACQVYCLRDISIYLP